MNDDFMKHTLPMSALDEVPDVKADSRFITGLVKHSGKISGYQLSDGSIVDKEEGIALARQGELRGVGIAHRGDSEYLKSLPDGRQDNNLSSLPTVETPH